MKDFHLDVKDEESLVLVGPSGRGKSTTLRMIAGLESISEGKLYIDGDAVNDLPSKDRDIAMVFQNYALYPHMTVFDNMAFGLKLRKSPKKKSQSESGRPLIFWKSGICSSGNRRLFQADSGAGCARPVDRAGAESVSDGRAAFQLRREIASDDARRNQQAPSAFESDHRLCDA